MKLNLLATTAILLAAFVPRCDCRAIERPAAGAGQLAASAALVADGQRRRTGPVLQRLGEEYFIRFDNGNSDSAGPSSPTYPGGSVYNRALQLQLTRRLLQGKVGDESTERGRRSEDPPISLDLTFHLLREMMEMSRAEQLAQQAQNNRRMMELFGK
ncbi:corticotropin releasing hormone b [Lampris incognitus]|uniref:corticotropin releasing hormone b n=1 Tax=Lampris incognitus TaxID=2546036 RepID=UPI0024B5972B|nr:corticotropin releasing hormone b [Lampris incognitus]